MDKPIIILHEEHTPVYSSILECLDDAFNDESTSDLTFIVENRSIYIHKAILKIRCQHFKNMFQHNWSENNQSVIEHNEFSYTVFKAFLKYLYTDVVSLPLEEAVELLRLADVYCEENLKQHCIRIIKQKVCIENLHFLYDIALQYNAKELEHFCISIILDITSEVEQNEIEEPPTEDSPRLDINRIKTELIEAQMRIQGVNKERGNFEFITRRKIANLKFWPIFRFVKPEFVSGIHKVMVYGIFGDKALAVMKNKKVYALNSSNRAYFQNCYQDNTLHPKEVKRLCGKDLKTFVCNRYSQILALTYDGKVYFWDDNHVDELDNSRIDELAVPRLMNMRTTPDSIRKRVADIACSDSHFLVATEEGEVFAWGSNISGECGIDSNLVEYQRVPRQVTSGLAGKKVVQVACGESFSIAVTENGKVYSWGYNRSYQLGRDCTGNKIFKDEHAVRIKSLRRITKVVCGLCHTIALNDEGKIYTWSAHNRRQLGVDLYPTLGDLLLRLPCKYVHALPLKMGRIIDIGALCFSEISAAVNEHGNAYVWGRCGTQDIAPMITPFSSVHDALACYASPSGMHKPLILHDEDIPVLPSWNIFECLEDAFNDESTSDLTILVEKQPIYVHKAILKIRSQYFKDMLQQNRPENNQSVIEHTEFSYITFKTFLKYLYTDLVDVPLRKEVQPEVTVELLKAARVYSEDSLARRCMQLIKQNIRRETVFNVYCFAIKFNVKEVEEFCINFAVDHITEMEEKINEVTTTEVDAERLDMLKTFKSKLYED